MTAACYLNKEKIGNLLIYIASNIQPLYHTQLLKLMYLIDEEAVKEDGVPVTWLDYKVWKLGPVAQEAYDVKFRSNFNEYVDVIQENGVQDQPCTLIIPAREFDDGEFSEFEMEIIDRVLKKYKHYTSAMLVDLTHLNGTLWSIIKDEHNLDFTDSNTSDHIIDFTQLLKDDENKYDNYRGAKETMMFNSQLQPCLDNPEHMHPVQKEKERQIGSKRFDLNSHSGRYAPIFREKSGIQFIFIESLEKAAVR